MIKIHGTVPLEARLEKWMETLLADPEKIGQLITTHGSPVNIIDPRPLARNAAELVAAGRRHGVDTKVFFARKANKVLALVDAALAAGHGIDVASHSELAQVLSRGANPERIIVTAAIKDAPLMRTAIQAGVTVSLDNLDELQRAAGIAASEAGHGPAPVALRLAPDPRRLAPTRFGERTEVWAAQQIPRSLSAVGVHVHLNGYSEADRRTALAEAIALVEHLRDQGHSADFIDLGGGVPMSYVADRGQWEHYLSQIAAQRCGAIPPFTWKNDPLNNTYPFWQQPTRGDWLDALLSGEVDGFGTAAHALGSRNIALHLEPGRSVLDGCGVILAEVSFIKTRSDDLPLVGLAMNRTQCRTAADDFLLDPLLVPIGDSRARAERSGMTGFFVGAYCIEDEVILRRRMSFPEGIAVGDVVALPNTAGYFMHILESASHQIPLARNVVLSPGGSSHLDDIDA